MTIIPLGIFTELESAPASEKSFSLVTIISSGFCTELDHLSASEGYSVVGIATGYELDDRTVGVRVPVG
jgi:hypothetical protein